MNEKMMKESFAHARPSRSSLEFAVFRSTESTARVNCLPGRRNATCSVTEEAPRTTDEECGDGTDREEGAKRQQIFSPASPGNQQCQAHEAPEHDGDEEGEQAGPPPEEGSQHGRELHVAASHPASG